MRNQSIAINSRFEQKRGFALIVTLSLMILLTVIAVGLLSLSSISLRSSASSSSVAEARQNARLSMILAIGQLQLLTGQDTRVTARSTLSGPTAVTLTGAWRSWEGSDRDSAGKPIAPSYASKNSAADISKPFDTGSGSGRFLGWLTSTASTVQPNVATFPEVTNTPAAGYIPLVTTKQVTDSSQQIHIKPTLVKNGKGGIAWWTSGDNSKAMINTDRGSLPSSMQDWQARVRSNGRADAKSFGLEKVDTYAAGTIIPSTGTLKLVNAAAERRKIHDLTAYSRGLLTNTATGGWRKDLSLMSENYASLPSGNLPLLTKKPGEILSYAKAASSRTNALIYPWSVYRASESSPAWQQVPPICSWDALVDYTQQYKYLTSSTASQTSMSAFSSGHGGSGDRINYQEKVRRIPQLARVHWIYSLSSAPATGANVGKYRPGLLVTPVVTLWNPYNVKLSVGSFGINFKESSPISFKFKVGSQVYPETTVSQICKGGFQIKIDSTITLAPGESRIFSLNSPTVKENTAANNVVITPGYAPTGGFLFYGINGGADVYTSPTETFGVDKITYNAKTDDDGAQGIGIYFDILVDGSTKGAHRSIYDKTTLGGPAVVDQLYPPLTNKVSATVGEVSGTKSRPFASAIFAYRMASPMARDAPSTMLNTKGMLQANPLCYYSETGDADGGANGATLMAGSGNYHPVNAPYDFTFQEVNGWNDTSGNLPQFESGSNASYIVSGMTPGDGLTRCVMAELPTRPLASLAELQHFDARNNNPVPPFSFNLIGNSSANPIFAPAQLSVATTRNSGMVNDDSYLLNNLLFDDWFVSSITKDLKAFSSATNRTANAVYSEHLKLDKPLPNRFYLPAPGAEAPDVNTAASKAMSNTKDSVTGKYSFETVASKLEVEGMFNINSTSLEAWKALLRQGRAAQVPYLDAAGATKLGSASSYAFPRTTIAGDQGTDSNSKDSNSLFRAAAEFAGNRVLTDAQIDALAGEIVSEIRKRGPFLSLSEFVNRQLTNNKDLAAAGTIQKSLDNLANMGNSPKNPFSVLQQNSVHITSIPAGNTDYKFPEAALGWSAFGVPGWVRQADILKPLAPLLSARDDTFTIRAYGDARDPANSSRILARAWCEVVVQRRANFVDPSDDAAITPFSPQMKSQANKRFGRRYEVISFRWLNESEV
ncbi:MAG: hypothetical protein ABIS50_00950 [Luteolibacter sp.]